MSGLRRYGIGQWAMILDQFEFSNRNAVMLKDKYRYITISISSQTKVSKSIQIAVFLFKKHSEYSNYEVNYKTVLLLKEYAEERSITR